MITKIYVSRRTGETAFNADANLHKMLAPLRGVECVKTKILENFLLHQIEVTGQFNPAEVYGKLCSNNYVIINSKIEK